MSATQHEPENVLERRYGTRAGKRVFAIPSKATKDTANGRQIVVGHKPTPDEHVVPVRDYEPLHEALVRQAVASGKHVPPEVLKEYPHLAPKPPTPSDEGQRAAARAAGLNRTAPMHRSTFPVSGPAGKAVVEQSGGHFLTKTDAGETIHVGTYESALAAAKEHVTNPIEAGKAAAKAAAESTSAPAANPVKSASMPTAAKTVTPEDAGAKAARAAAGKGGYTLAEHGEFLKRLGEGKITPDELKANYARVKEHGEAIKAELGKRTVDELNRGSFRKMKKADAVDSNYRQMLDHHNVTDSLSYMIGGRDAHQNALDAKVESITPEHLATYAANRQKAVTDRAEKLDKIKGAIENPKTLEDYSTFARAKGRAAMTDEQRAEYDRLSGEYTRNQRQQDAERAAVVAKVNAPTGLDMTIHQTKHTKTGAPLHVAVLNQRVEKDKYHELNAKAKALGGYYSSYRGGGAIPGFQFDNAESAGKFKSLLSGSVDTSEDLRAHQAETRQSAAARLRETADRTHAAAQETLDADRKTNTARRADMASGIEARARKDIAAAQTMRKVADKLDRGESSALSGIRARTHVEQLDAVLNRARWNHIQADEKANPNRSYQEREDARNRSPDQSDVEHAEYPHPKIWASDLQKHAAALADVPGLKNIGKSMAAVAKEAGPQFKKQGNGFKFHGGQLLNPDALKEQGIVLHGVEGKHVRVHASHDYRLSQESEKQGGPRMGPFYTADGGKTFSHGPNGAIAAAANRGHPLDLVDAPQDKQISITSPGDIENLDTAANRLKNHPNRDLQRIGESLRNQVEDYKRLRAANIHNPWELRTALREHLALKANTEQADPVKMKERALVGQKIPGFFPTPRPLVDRMLDAADIQPGHSVLEPSAGKGDILDAVAERHPEAQASAIEPNSSLRDILQAKGHNVADHDFLQHAGQYDRIVMNPPFENGQDMAHVQHAYDQLKPGGKMVSVMSSGPFHREDAKAKGFRDWLGTVGGEHEPLPEGSFAGSDAFRQTGVNTHLVTIHKPHDAGAQAAARAAGVNLSYAA